VSNNSLGTADNRPSAACQSCIGVRATISGSRIFALQHSHRSMQSEPLMEIAGAPAADELRVLIRLEDGSMKMDADSDADELIRLCPSQWVCRL
jgi:hypothetical protein